MVNPLQNGQVIHSDLKLKPGVYDLPDGVVIEADNITIDGNGATLVGRGQKGVGITVNGRKGVKIQNTSLQSYRHGIHASDCHDLTVTGCHITATAEVDPATEFLNIWRKADDPYGSGILLHNVTDSKISYNNLQHQMVGLLSYHCRNMTVTHNLTNYNSGFGFHLYGTSDSLFEHNQADFCCRYQPRGEGRGHMGADAAGFLIVAGASRNIFRHNTARMGGDGFFLAGLNPQYEHRPCDDNLFEENDASYSPNIGFEATFSGGNVFRQNRANFCNYGFWLGFSRENVVEDNEIVACRAAGIAVENGIDCQVRGNTVRSNGHGLLLWSKRVAAFEAVVPDNDTSRRWLIENNHFERNVKGIRVAADKDHGINHHPGKAPRPRDHTIRQNVIRQNRVAIELIGVEDTKIQGNSFAGNREKIIRE